MIVDAASVVDSAPLESDVVVIGAGPAGIVLALELARSGVDVLVIESGLETFSDRVQALSEAAEFDHELHAPMSIATRRQVGGTSTIWGGRCVPYDPVDFDFRPFIGDTEWPISYDDVLPYYERACTWMECGRPVFNVAAIPNLPKAMVPGLVDGEVRSSDLERWSLPTDFGKIYRQQLRDANNLRLIVGLTCVKVICLPGEQSVDHLECKTLDGSTSQVYGKRYVLAAGGLESTRLLLASTGPDGGAIGNHSDHLGRWYMSHLEGVISNVHFTTPPRQTLYDYERDIDGAYIRRRFSFSREYQHERGLPNIVAWLANPELANPVHASGILSFVYLVLSSPLGKYAAPDAQRRSLTGERIPGAPYGGAKKGPILSHLKNILRQPLKTLRFIFGFGIRRVFPRRRSPGFFVYSPENVYPLQYHGEHRPHRESRVTLAEECDELGMPRIQIDIRFSDDDIEGVIAAHRCWDEYLRQSGCGRVEYLHDDLPAEVRARAGGGFHQVGTTRMSKDPKDGVVDENLAVHGVKNLFVVSSSTFVTSSQANSTFLIVIFAIRLADHLRQLEDVASRTNES